MQAAIPEAPDPELGCSLLVKEQSRSSVCDLRRYVKQNFFDTFATLPQIFDFWHRAKGYMTRVSVFNSFKILKEGQAK